MVEGVYYFLGEPEDLGLNHEPYTMKFPWVPMVLENEEDLMIFKKRLKLKMDQQDEKKFCTMESNGIDDGWLVDRFPPVRNWNHV